MRDIGKNIRTLREKKGMTQEELAQALFVTRQTVSNYETGWSRPDIEMLVRIAQALETDVNQVLYGLPVEQDKQREAKRLAVGCLTLAAIFLLLTLPAPLLNEMLKRGNVGAVLVTALTNGLLRPALWLILGWCALGAVAAAGDPAAGRADVDGLGPAGCVASAGGICGAAASAAGGGTDPGDPDRIGRAL